MNRIFEFLIEPYTGYSLINILLEAGAVILGILSVWCAKQNKIAVYPTGMISTGIYVYLLFQAGLVGDLMINAYYFIMSIYGWYFWTLKKETTLVNSISRMNTYEKRWWFIFFMGIIFFVSGIYILFDKWKDWSAPIDTFTTAIFFIAMWLMARKKIEHWFFGLLGTLFQFHFIWARDSALPVSSTLSLQLLLSLDTSNGKKY